MPTDNEKRVLLLLSSTDLDPNVDPGKIIESWGTEAVTIVCEVSLNSYPGLDKKIRTNAIAALGGMTHPQAKETTLLLVKDADPDVCIRGLRGAARQKNDTALDDLTRMLKMRNLEPLVAIEIVKALGAFNTPAAQKVLADYAVADPTTYPHRSNSTVSKYLRDLGVTSGS